MSNTVDIKVEDVNTKMDTYTGIEVYSASSVSGAYSLLTTLTLVEDDIFYEYEDTAGDITTWYKYRFHNATGPVNSVYSNPFGPRGATRKTARQKAITEYKCGAVLIAGATQTLASLQTEDIQVKNTLYSTKRGQGGWTHPTSGSRVGETRRITASNSTTGAFSVAPDMDGALASGDEFEWHWFASPDDWNLAINRGLLRYYYLDRIALVGNGVAEQSLSYLPWLRRRNQVTGLWYYPLDDDTERAWGSGGNWWSTRQEGGYLTLMTKPALTTANTVYIEAIRQMDEVHLDTDLFPAQADVDLIAAFAYDELLSSLIHANSGGLSGSDVSTLRANRTHHRKNRLAVLVDRNRLSPRWQNPQAHNPTTIPSPWSAR